MAFKVNGLDVINDSSEVAQMVATTAEAQAGVINNKVMTPQRTKELIQGGTVSVIKSLQRIDFKLGEWNIGGTIRYISMGGAAGLVPQHGGADPNTGVTFFSAGNSDTSCFFNFPSKNRYKTMILIADGGSSATNQGSFMAQGNSNAPAFDNFSACARFTNSSGSNTNTDIQVSHTDYITFNDNPNVLLEPPKSEFS